MGPGGAVTLGPKEAPAVLHGLQSGEARQEPHGRAEVWAGRGEKPDRGQRGGRAKGEGEL
jgi:hypothetical protein